MGKAVRLIRFVDRLQSRLFIFVASFVLLATLLAGAGAAGLQASQQEKDLRLAHARTVGLLKAVSDGSLPRNLDTIIGIELRELDKLERELRQARHHQDVLLSVGKSLGLCLILLATLTVAALRRSFVRERACREELRDLALTGELPGLANSREFRASLARAISASRRSGKSLAVAIVEIDHFKTVNDRYGLPAGDEVIRKVALTALASVRGCDVIARIGGEDFALILPGAGIAQAYGVCERLRQRIHEEHIELPGGERIQVSISSGIARLLRDDNPDALHERAERALYAARDGGRDQVRLAA